MGCKNYICEENDPCETNAPKDEVNDKAPEKETVEVKQGDTWAPGPGFVMLGSVTWECEMVLGQEVKAKRVNTLPSASISLPPGSKIPGSVIADCIKKLNDGEGKALLETAKDDDAKAKFIAETTNDDWQKAIEESMGYTGGKYLPGGSKFNEAVIKKTITIIYYTSGNFEGCEEGSSEQYANEEEGSPCGYGRWEILPDLFWERPSNPTLLTTFATPQPYNPLQDQATWTLQMETARANANAAWLQAITSVPSYYTGPVYLHAGPASAPDGGSNGFNIGLGDIEFGGVTVYANNGDLGNNMLMLKLNAAKWDIPAWIQSEDPAAAAFYGVCRSASMDVDLINTITQAPYMGQAYNEFRQEVGPVIQNFINIFKPKMTQHISTQVQTVTVVQQIVINAPAAPAQAIPTGAVSVNGVAVKNSTEVKNVGGQKGTCWLARAVYGENNPEWKKFRKYIYNIAPEWQKDVYTKYAPRLAKYAKNNNFFRLALRNWMNTKIRNIPEYSL